MDSPLLLLYLNFIKTNCLLHLWYLQEGSQKICLESPGAHELQLSDSCISFASNSIKIDVSKPQVLFVIRLFLFTYFFGSFFVEHLYAFLSVAYSSEGREVSHQRFDKCGV